MNENSVEMAGEIISLITVNRIARHLHWSSEREHQIKGLAIIKI